MPAIGCLSDAAHSLKISGSHHSRGVASFFAGTCAGIFVSAATSMRGMTRVITSSPAGLDIGDAVTTFASTLGFTGVGFFAA